MAGLTGQTVATSYEQLLIVADGGLTSSLQAIQDGDGGITSCLKIARNKLEVIPNSANDGNLFEISQYDGTSILNVASNTPAATLLGTLTVGVDGTGHDVIFYSGTAGDNLTWDASEEVLQITGTDGQTALDVLDGDLRVVDKIYLYDRGGEYISGNGSILSIVGGSEIDLTATAIDINGTVDISGTLALNDDVTIPHGKKIIFDSADTYIYANTDDPEDLYVKADADILLIPDGNVGIGALVPVSKFEVTGTSTSNTDVGIMQVTTGTGVSANYKLTIGILDGKNAFIQSVKPTDNQYPLCLNPGGGTVGMGIHNPISNFVSASPIHYNTGTASQSGTTVTGSGTTWTTAMIGSEFVYIDGTSSGLITARASNTSITVTTSQSVSSQGYSIHYVGLNITNAGNVGIGTATPDVKFEVEGTGDPSIVGQVKATALTDTDTAMWRVSGTGNSVVAISEIGVYYQAASETNAPVGYLRLEAGDGVLHYIWPDDDDDLRTSPTKTDIGKDDVGTVIGAQSSDERLKNISSDAFPYGLIEVNKLTPIQYSWKAKANPVNKLGFGAQTVQSIIPESVYDTGQCIDGYTEGTETVTRDGVEYEKEVQTANSDNSDTKLGMQYVQIIPVLVKAVQELSAKVTALENA